MPAGVSQAGNSIKIVIAPDSFKESLSAVQAAQAIEAGLREIWPQAQYVSVPIADGGEGTVQALVAATDGELHTHSVTGPLGECVKAEWGLTGNGQTAVIEMAAAAGLALVPNALRDPTTTTTYGVGELIRIALDAGARQFVIGLGGSATNDGGAGMLQALGTRLLDQSGKPIGFGGLQLANLVSIDVSALDSRLADCHFSVACDVDNPLCGPQGASVIFGPQKGATAAQVAQLDAALARFAAVIQQQFNRDVANVPGAGAAGGMGAALLAFLPAHLQPGIGLVLEAAGLARHLAGADLVITGEGRIDGQTLHGKAPLGVAQLAAQHGKPVIAFAGSVGTDAGLLHAHGISAIFSIQRQPGPLAEALLHASHNLRLTARNVAAAMRCAGWGG